jgi:TetR/AcrR family transcriptional repressor of bet genes
LARASLRKIRRLELRKAAYEVACQYGVSGLTLERVADHAGISKGVIHHYFDSKYHLVEYATRYAHGIFGRAMRDKIKKARTPSERLWAVVEASFLPEVLTPEFSRLWFDTLNDNRLYYLFDTYRRREWSNLIFALKQLGSPKEATDIAYAITNFYDGYWVLAAIELGLTRKTVLPLIADYIKDLVPQFDMGAVKFDE